MKIESILSYKRGKTAKQEVTIKRKRFQTKRAEMTAKHQMRAPKLNQPKIEHPFTVL